jgi:hypothetical protein
VHQDGDSAPGGVGRSDRFRRAGGQDVVDQPVLLGEKQLGEPATLSRIHRRPRAGDDVLCDVDPEVAQAGGDLVVVAVAATGHGADPAGEPEPAEGHPRA